MAKTADTVPGTALGVAQAVPHAITVEHDRSTPADGGRAALDRARRVRTSLLREALRGRTPGDRVHVVQPLTRLDTDLDPWERSHSGGCRRPHLAVTGVPTNSNET